MLHRRVFVFIDNEAARQTLISHSSASRSMQAVLLPIAMKLAQMSAFMWFSRVPSLSNPADAPSRLIFVGDACFGAKLVVTSFELPAMT